MVRNLIALAAVLTGLLFMASIIQADAGKHAVDLHPPTIIASAFARDGIIEAIEPVDLDGHSFILGVQWHPETLIRESENHPFSLPILLSFMEEVHEVSSK